MDFDKLFPGHYKLANAIMIAEGMFAVTLAYQDDDGEWVLTDEGKKRSGVEPEAKPAASATKKKAVKVTPEPTPEPTPDASGDDLVI